MEFLRPSRRRTLLSDILYIIFNIGVALAIFGVVVAIGSPLAAFAIVLLSKWRVFAVRPQYWYTHLVANSVDIIVGLSYVVLLTRPEVSLAAQIVLTALYIAWLLILKPQSKRVYVVAQAAVGLLLGTTALAYLSHDWFVSFVVIGMWLIGYTSGRHVFQAYNEPHARIFSMIWALIVAEIGWISYHWTLSYTIPLANIELPQVTLILGFVGFLAERAYASYHKHHEVRLGDLTLPLFLSMSSLVLLLTVFNGTQGI